MATLSAKRGDTLTIDGTRTDRTTGAAVSLVGASVACEIKIGETRQALSVEILSAEDGTFRLSLDAEATAGLRVGLWRSDVEFTDASGQVVSTDTFLLQILEDVTNAAG